MNLLDTLLLETFYFLLKRRNYGEDADERHKVMLYSVVLGSLLLTLNILFFISFWFKWHPFFIPIWTPLLVICYIRFGAGKKYENMYMGYREQKGQKFLIIYTSITIILFAFFRRQVE